MKSLRVVGLLVAAGLFAPAATVSAQRCPAGCGMQKKACLQTGRVAKLACKQDCRATVPATNLGACMRGCMDQFRTAKNTCAGNHADCMGLCPPTPPPGSCTGAFLDSCGQDLATCARGVVAQAKTCVQGCGTAPDRLGCLQGCAATAQHDAATCAANFAACVRTCACPGGCDDGNPCTFDTCVNGECRHECLCVGPAGEVTCCPGPGPCPVSSTTTTTIPTGCGTCFSTIGMQCTTQVCSASMPCRLPNEFCSPVRCPAPCPPSSTTTTTTTLPGEMCQTDADCDDGNPCTHDACVNGMCVHECLCVTSEGALTCCPGPAALCVTPCGSDASGACGGSCPPGASCENLPGATTCGCVSGVGGPCGGNLFAPPPVCAAGLVCQQGNPDATGVCVTTMPCIPFFQFGCSVTSDCCQPCGPGIIPPCAVCLQRQCMGAP